MSLKALVASGCGGRSYVALKLSFAPRWFHLLHHKVLTYGRCLLHAVNSANAAVSSMQLLGTTSLLLGFPPESNVFATVVRVARDLAYASTKSAIIFMPDKGFRPDPASNGSRSWNVIFARACFPDRPPVLCSNGASRPAAGSRLGA